MKKVCVVLASLLLCAGIALAQSQEESLGEIARRLRAEREKGPKARHVYTNDDLARLRRTAISIIGRSKPAAGPTIPAAETETAATEPTPEQDEQAWRLRFSEMRNKIATAEKELDLLQRELQLQQVQFYQDPNEAMRQQYTRGQINETRQKIQDKQAEIERLRQELRDLEDELRRAGGKPAWARP